MTSIRAPPRDSYHYTSAGSTSGISTSSIIGFLNHLPRTNNWHHHNNCSGSSSSSTNYIQMRRRIILGFAACVLLVSLWGPGSIVGMSSSQKQQQQHSNQQQPPRKEEQEMEERTQEFYTSSAATSLNTVVKGPTTIISVETSTPASEEEESSEVAAAAAAAAAAGPDQPVSSKLECRDSVLEFVINASDQKDECDGLRRAFVTACTNLDMAGQIFTSETNNKNNNNNFIHVHTNTNFDSTNPNLVHTTTTTTTTTSTTNPGGERQPGERSRRRRRQTYLLQLPPLNNHPALPYDDDYYDNDDDELGEEEEKDLTMRISLLQSRQRTLQLDTTTTQQQQRRRQQQPQQPQQAHHSTLYSHAQSILDSPESIEARTCCASILNVFHEHCDRNEEVEYTDRSLFVIVSVIAMCSIVKSLIKHFEIRWLPEAAGCILVGLILGSIIEQVPNIHYSFDGSLFLRVMLPFIVFHAALSIDKHALFTYLFPIALYAVVGTLLSSALVALFIYVGTGFGMPLVESCIFGALISSIDPIAVLSILQSLGMTTTDAIYVIIFGESLFNDGIAIVLYETLVEFLDETIVITSEEIIDSCVQFLVVILGSIAVGALCGGFCTLYFYSMEGCQTPLVEVLVFLCWALIPYYICDGVSWSGIVGIVAAGIVMDLFVVGYHTDQQQQQLQQHQSNSTSSHQNGSTSISSQSMYQHHRRNTSSSGSVNNNSSNNLLCCEVFQRIFSRKGHLSNVARNHVGFVAEINATLMETAIFAYLGLFLLSSRYKWNLYLTTLAILSCLVSRAVMIPSLSFIANRINAKARSTTTNAGGRAFSCLRKKNYSLSSTNDTNNSDTMDEEYSFEGSRTSSQQDRSSSTMIDQRMQIVLWFGGLRGAMSFALVENIPLYDASTGYGSRLKPELKAMTSASIIFTVFICGGTTFYLLDRLGMSAFSMNDSEMIELTSPLTTPKRSSTTASLMDSQPQPPLLMEKTSPIAPSIANGSSTDTSTRNMGRDISKVRHR